MNHSKALLFLVSWLTITTGCGFIAAPRKHVTVLSTVSATSPVIRSDNVDQPPVFAPDLMGRCETSSVWGSSDPESCAAALRSHMAAEREKELVQACTSRRTEILPDGATVVTGAVGSEFCQQLLRNLAPADNPLARYNRNVVRAAEARSGGYYGRRRGGYSVRRERDIHGSFR